MGLSWEKVPRRLCIEEYEHAMRRGAPVYAEVLGYSLNNEAYHMTTPLPSGESVIACMTDALADARLAPGDIDYINAHASGTQLNDANECSAIRAVFGAHSRARGGERTKPFTAHRSAPRVPWRRCCARSRSNTATSRRQLHLRNPDPACDLDVVPMWTRTSAALRDEQRLRLRRHQRGAGSLGACDGSLWRFVALQRMLDLMLPAARRSNRSRSRN
jgi:3-oxoacyl-(acyl-carrier-protein) synthase